MNVRTVTQIVPLVVPLPELLVASMLDHAPQENTEFLVHAQIVPRDVQHVLKLELELTAKHATWLKDGSELRVQLIAF